MCDIVLQLVEYLDVKL